MYVVATLDGDGGMDIGAIFYVRRNANPFIAEALRKVWGFVHDTTDADKWSVPKAIFTDDCDAGL